jgi:hypothetical protein
MPQTNLIQFLVRQGTDLQRQTVVLQSGELGMNTDAGYQRLFIGDGTHLGGWPVSSKLFWITNWSAASATVLPFVQLNDIVYNIQTQYLYGLSAFPSTLSANYIQIAKNF